MRRPRAPRRRRRSSASTSSSTARCSRSRARCRRRRPSRAPASTSSRRVRRHRSGRWGSLPTVSAGRVGRAIDNGMLSREGSPGIRGPALAQVVYTMTQFPTARGQDRRQALHAAGLRGRDAGDPRRVAAALRDGVEPDPRAGTANTFEATFQYEVDGPDGKVLAKHFVTATSGQRHARHLRLHDEAVRRRRATGRSSSTSCPRRTARGSTRSRIPLHFTS